MIQKYGLLTLLYNYGTRITIGPLYKKSKRMPKGLLIGHMLRRDERCSWTKEVSIQNPCSSLIRWWSYLLIYEILKTISILNIMWKIAIECVCLWREGTVPCLVRSCCRLQGAVTGRVKQLSHQHMLLFSSEFTVCIHDLKPPAISNRAYNCHLPGCRL